MFSGGIDSTYVLWDALTSDHDDLIHVHHISLRNVENRWKQEADAVERIINYLSTKQLKPFNYTESIWSFPFTGYFCWDIDIVAFVASQVAQNLSGHVTIYTGGYEDWRQGLTGVHAIMKKHAEIANSILAITCREKDVEKKLCKPLIGVKKSEVIKKLPKDLLSLTWSCRKPVDEKPCGVCVSCKELSEV